MVSYKSIETKLKNLEGLRMNLSIHTLYQLFKNICINMSFHFRSSPVFIPGYCQGDCLPTNIFHFSRSYHPSRHPAITTLDGVIFRVQLDQVGMSTGVALIKLYASQNP